MSNIECFQNQNYVEIKKKLLENLKLFEDELFPKANISLYKGEKPVKGFLQDKNGHDIDIVWKRPSEIIENPQFLVGEFSRKDLHQGSIGNCWFITALANLTMRDKLRDFVIPQNQTFDKNDYQGIFHFRFWKLGKWFDVVIDDYLPVKKIKGTLVFCRNIKEKNEFWSCLVEKAYAKFVGCYEWLIKGYPHEGLVNMSGGSSESLYIKDYPENDKELILWNKLEKALKFNSSVSTSIKRSGEKVELILKCGLVESHAYALNKAANVNLARLGNADREILEKKTRDNYLRLVRLRNPWGNDKEWNGNWCDKCPLWDHIPDDLKNMLELNKEEDGEFWMDYEAYLQYFNRVSFVHLSPNDIFDQICIENATFFESEWVVGKNAGGSRLLDKKSFWTNPQFCINLKGNTDMNNVFLFVSLMTETSKALLRETKRSDDDICKQICLLKVNDDVNLNKFRETNFKFNNKVLSKIGTSGKYKNDLEVTAKFSSLLPGHYVIIPSTFGKDVPAKFFLRIFCNVPIENEDFTSLEDESNNNDVESETNANADGDSQLNDDDDDDDAVDDIDRDNEDF